MRELKGERLEKELERLRLMHEYENAHPEAAFIAGIDEAGRGPLAGPVVAACCILPRDVEILYLNDSKKLSEKRREALFPEVQEKALAYGVGIIDEETIDEINILQADYEAMRVAINLASKMLEEKGLSYEVIAEFHYVLIMSRESPAAGKEEICLNDLKPLVEIVHGDPYVPSLPVSVIKKEEQSESPDRQIFIFERGGQFDLLVENPETYMWVSPLPQKIIDRYELVQRVCPEQKKLYRDVLIRRKNYQLGELDKKFIDELCASRRRWLS